jgi:diguanylate cyclase (GGDEF)-like protein
MRIALSVIFSILIISLLVCMVFSMCSKKPVGKAVAFLIAGMATPVLGNLILIISSAQLISTIGYYIYFIGMDVAVYSSWYFTHIYCDIGKPKKTLQIPILIFFALDMILYTLNPFFNCSFSTEPIMVEERAYFRLVPYLGQTYHRVICYGLFFAILIIFAVKTIKATKVYKEKYRVILFSMIATVAVESYYIFSRQPLDISMVGFGIFGLLVYFFALKYRPLKLLDRMLASMASEMPDALFFFDRSGKCIWVNEPGKMLVGINKENYDEVKADLNFLFDDIDLSGSGWSKRITLGTGDEAMYYFLSMKSVVNDKKKVIGSYLSVRDITEDQREMKREMYRATHDSLTGIYTKEYLYENIRKRLENDRNTNYMIGFIEVTNYKLINDVFGSEFGDYTIKHIADYISNNTSKKVLYGRLSTDSFGILLDKDTLNLDIIEKRLENFTVKDDNLEHRILIHIGIYDINPDDETDIPLFFDSARLAATMIRDDYKKHIIYYDDKLRNELIHNQLISNQVKEAIETRQIRPYLQPIVDSRGMLAGAEALVRWIHPDEGFMNPGMFIPVFERNGLIADVDRHMWRCVCEILADWKKRGIDNFISINISPKDFYYMDVVSELKKLVEEFGIEPVKLRVEITETAIMTGSIDILKLVKELREYGFIVEMDDFGSGYSSLNLLKDMDIDVIKIDMQFLKDSESNIKANTIIKNIINMSEDLGIDTLTEGVETARQYEKLYAMGCKLYQGYYFSKPVPLEDFEKQWFD